MGSPEEVVELQGVPDIGLARRVGLTPEGLSQEWDAVHRTFGPVRVRIPYSTIDEYGGRLQVRDIRTFAARCILWQGIGPDSGVEPLHAWTAVPQTIAEATRMAEDPYRIFTITPRPLGHLQSLLESGRVIEPSHLRQLGGVLARAAIAVQQIGERPRITPLHVMLDAVAPAPDARWAWVGPPVTFPDHVGPRHIKAQTLLYSAPEEFHGEDATVYAIGAVLHAAATGPPPVTDGGMAELLDLASGGWMDHGRLSGVDPALLDTIVACTDPDPRARPALHALERRFGG